ncbi:MAG: tetratricopeptide repeat protein, partial [Verrucomicrobia bacterium]|nr:tetratricopeptide repeat protein [Verrucomicrobiota bacterium]
MNSNIYKTLFSHRIHQWRNAFRLLVLGVPVALTLSAGAQSASDLTTQALEVLGQADQARDNKQDTQAIPLFETAYSQFKTIHLTYPTWQPQVIRFRMNYAQDQLQRLLRQDGKSAPEKSTLSQTNSLARIDPLPKNNTASPPSTRANSLKSQVRHLLFEGDSKAARDILMDALMENPDDAGLRLLAATAQCMEGQYMDALFILEELAL